MFVAVAALFAGCKKEIDFTGMEGKQYVVVMAQLQPDSVAVVNLAYSRFFLNSDTPKYINDASMTLWVNGTAYTPSSVSEGNYQFPVSPVGGDSVWFEADVPGHGTISAATRVVSHPQIENVFVTATTGYEFWRMMDLQYIQADITDPADEKDFYRFEVIERDRRPEYEEDEAIDTIFRSYFLYLGLKEVGDTSRQDIFSAEMATALVISDKEFSGETKSVGFISTPIVDTTGLTTRDYWLRVVVYSPDMFEFRRSASMASSSYSMFAEPMQTYSNIKGDAIGVFASQSSMIFPAPRIQMPEAKRRRK